MRRFPATTFLAVTLHLAMNLGLLWWVGRIVERRTASLALLGVYLGSALAGGLFILWNASLHPRAGVSLEVLPGCLVPVKADVPREPAWHPHVEWPRTARPGRPAGEDQAGLHGGKGSPRE